MASFLSFTSAFELLVHFLAVKGGLPYWWGNQNTTAHQPQEDLRICGRPLAPPVHGGGKVTSEEDPKTHYTDMPVTENRRHWEEETSLAGGGVYMATLEETVAI